MSERSGGDEVLELSGLNMARSATSARQPLWTVEDVAHYLRLEAETVRIMARSGKLPAIKVGRVWRFHSQQIEQWVQQALDKSIEASATGDPA